MAKLILLSVIIAMVTVPLVQSGARDARRGLLRTLLMVTLFNLFYVFVVRYIYPRFL